jgi:ABC-2 type transport system ATP-binding protein
MIEIQQLTKRYGDFTALDELTLTVNEGTIYGFVGSNGAGKTTTFSIMATLLQPTSGDIIVNGKSVVRDPQHVRALIGYMPDFFGVYDQLKADEYLDFYGSTYGMSSQQRAEKIPEILALVRLENKRFEYVDNLSRGMKQRLCLARALLHNPQILILDEPASGLDPIARIEMRDILKQLKAEGKTIFISSHILPELAEICDEICVLSGGKLIAQGNIAAIQAQLAGDRAITVVVKEKLQEASQFFSAHDNVQNLEINTFEQKLTFRFTGDDDAQHSLLKNAILQHIQVLSFHVEEKNLEDVFIEITKGASGNEGA